KTEPVTARAASAPGQPPRALARPLAGLTIDGRLDDWPSGMTRYSIRNVFSGTGDYRHPVDGPEDIDAEFQVGYNPKDGRIYLAVVVRDDNLVVGKSSSCVANDAVEVYVQGRRSDPRPTGKSWADWPNGTLAEEMPILQYVGLPGDFPAYGDRFGANPSLLYSASQERRTEMKCHRSGGVTTYEWAIQPYDEYPGKRTRLQPGKTIGLEIAVVDRDSHRPKAAFLTWGKPPRIYKGFEPETLGNLTILPPR
ncbi:MAG: DOMON domain-containing protein, partial [Isosphaeraceae bacterium]